MVALAQNKAILVCAFCFSTKTRKIFTKSKERHAKGFAFRQEFGVIN
jgi:hypothetical protein